jgi:hypothetical protein
MSSRRVRLLLAEMAELRIKYPNNFVWEGDVQANRRVPVYAELQKLIDRPLTPDERNRLDKLMDSMGAPTR